MINDVKKEIKTELAERAAKAIGINPAEAMEMMESICRLVDCSNVTKDELYELLLIRVKTNIKGSGKKERKDDKNGGS